MGATRVITRLQDLDDVVGSPQNGYVVVYRSSDGKLHYEAQSGGGVPLQGLYRGGTLQSIPAGLSVDHLLNWHDLADGDAVLDLSDRARPTVLTNGTYLVSVEIQPQVAAGKIMIAYLYADFEGTFWDGPATRAALDDIGDGFNPFSLFFARYLTAGTNIVVSVYHNKSTPLDCNLWAHVVKLS